MKVVSRTTHPTCLYITLCLFIKIILICSSPANASQHQFLSNEELNWLESNQDKLIAIYNPNVPPVTFQNEKGELEGLGADLTKLIEEQLGFKFTAVASADHPKLVQSLFTGESAIAPAIAITSKRSEFIHFCKPYISFPLVIITSRDNKHLERIQDFSGLKIAVLKGTLAEDYLRKYFNKTIEVVPVDTIVEGMRGVSFGTVAAMVGSHIAAAHYIDIEKIPNLIVSGNTDLVYPIGIAVSKKYPLLFSAIEKALANIPEDKIQSTKDKWIRLAGSGLSSSTVRILIALGVLVLLAAALMGLFSYYLKKQLAKQKATLLETELELREQNERFELAMGISNEGLWDWSVDKGEVYLSPQYHALLGYELGEIAKFGKDQFWLTHPEDLPMVKSAWEKTFSEGQFMDVEFRMKHKSREWIWVQSRANAVKRDSQGKAIRYVGTITDISNRKEAEKRLEDSELLFKAIVNTAIEGVVVAQGNLLVFVNPKAEEMIGVRQKDLLSKPFINYVHPDDQRMVQEYHRKRMARLDAQSAYDFRILRPSGDIVWVMMSAAEFDWKGEPAILCMLTDITERKEAAYKLQQSEDKFSRLFLLSPDPVFLVHLSDQKIADSNQAFTNMFGHSREDALGNTTKELGLYIDNSRRDQFYDRLGQGQMLSGFEIDGINQHGDIINLAASCQKLELNAEPYLLVTLRDMTETKRMNEMMIQTEKMISVGGIAAGIAHEINNPLGIILQAAQNMEIRVKPDFKKNIKVATELGLDIEMLDKYFKERMLDVFLDDIKSAAARAATIIRHMLDFSRRSESKRVVCDLEEIIDKAISLASTDYDLKKNYDFKRIKIIKDYDKELPNINCTITEIEQVVLNLLRNSAHAMGKDATVEPTITVRLSPTYDGVRIEIEDNGPGIPQDIQKRIFEPFFTTKDPGEGTGLGLSVSYFIVTKGHGGKMSIQSSPTGGACFTMDLPIACEG